MQIKVNIEKFDNIVAALIIAGSILVFDVNKPQLLIGWAFFFLAGIWIIKSQVTQAEKTPNQNEQPVQPTGGNDLPPEIKELLNKK